MASGNENVRYPVHTYWDLLDTLCKIETENQQIRNKKIGVVLAGGLLGILSVGLLMSLPFCKLTIIETITSYGSALAIGPVFNYIYFSSQADMLSEHKQQFWSSLKELFEMNEPNEKQKFKKEFLSLAEAKKILLEKLAEKLNENSKYGQ